jgi:hypothetical protein
VPITDPGDATDNDNQYTLTPSDDGHRIRSRVAGKNGSLTGNASTSNASRIVSVIALAGDS